MSKVYYKFNKKKLFRLVYRILISPAIFIFAPLYKLTRYFQSKDTKIVYSDILDGFTNYTFPTKAVEQLAKTRAEICSKCPFAKYSGAINKISVSEHIVEVKGMYCDACGCGLSAKIRSPKNFCPKGKW